MGETLSFADVKKKIAEHLKIALGIEEFEITFAKYEEENNVWKVNIGFEEGEWVRTALFSIDAETGEVREFKKNHYWRF